MPFLRGTCCLPKGRSSKTDAGPLVPASACTGVLHKAGEGRSDAYVLSPFARNYQCFLEQTDSGALQLVWSGDYRDIGIDSRAVVHAQLAQPWSADGFAWSGESRGVGTDCRAIVHAQLAQPMSVDSLKPPCWSLATVVSECPGHSDICEGLLTDSGEWLHIIYSRHAVQEFPRSAATWHSLSAAIDSNGIASTFGPGQRSQSKPRCCTNGTAATISTAVTSTDEGCLGAKTNQHVTVQLRSGKLARICGPDSRHADGPLNIVLSDDGGMSWPHGRALEPWGLGQELMPQFSFPTLREDGLVDGHIHVAYAYKKRCIKHTVISESWILADDDTRQ